MLPYFGEIVCLRLLSLFLCLSRTKDTFRGSKVSFILYMCCFKRVLAKRRQEKRGGGIFKDSEKFLHQVPILCSIKC